MIILISIRKITETDHAQEIGKGDFN